MPDPCVSDSSCIDLSVSGSPGALVASIIQSPDVGNRWECRSNGAYARDRISSLTYGPGTFAWEHFRVKQRGAGANMSVDVGLANTDMFAFLPDTSANPRITSYEYNGNLLNQPIAASDPTNPRVDMIILNPPVLPSLTPTLSVVAGTPVGGATLDNRNGIGAIPSGSILLADILVGATVTSIVTANIRDRRQDAPTGAIPWYFSANDIVQLEPPSVISRVPAISTMPIVSSAGDNFQVACAMFVSRRITATKLYWKYGQDTGTALTGTYALGLYDASGRKKVETGIQNFTGAISAIIPRTEVLASTVFERGWYYLLFGVDTTSAGNIFGNAVRSSTDPYGSGPGSPGVVFYVGVGGTTLPLAITATVFSDMFGATVNVNSPCVPICALGA